MAFVEPTLASFKARFPIFASAGDTAIEGALAQADGKVDQRWSEDDYTEAKNLYAAHILTMDGLGSSNEAKLAGFKRIKIGPIELERAAITSGADSMLTSTTFGSRYAGLARINFAGGTTT